MPTPGKSPGQAAVGIHFEIEKAIFGFPLEFIPCFMRDGDDKLKNYRELWYGLMSDTIAHHSSQSDFTLIRAKSIS